VLFQTCNVMPTGLQFFAVNILDMVAIAITAAKTLREGDEAMKRSLRAAAVCTTFVSLFMAGSALAAPFKFGVMADTQWKANLDGENPETVAVGIINQLNKQFIDQKVKFVIQVGDLVDKETDSPNLLPLNRTMDTRAAAAQALYDAGICFFPLRGNHEGSSLAAVEMPTLFPQTTGGGMTCGAGNFSSPDPYANGNLTGLTYKFDVDNARFVLLDQFTRKDNTNYLDSSNNNTVDQLPWIDATLSAKPADQHAFIFSHKNLIGANHTDMLFGATPAANPEAQNSYFSSLQKNGVRYHFGGHDHNHTRSIVRSPDGTASAQNIITSSNSYKFYTPKVPPLDQLYNLATYGYRETPIVQELYTVGYYIVTVDGPKVQVEHYASDNGCGGSLATGGVSCSLSVTPVLNFEKREAFGYSLNGKAFLVAQGQPYTSVEDGFGGTVAKILGGINGSSAMLYDGRATTKEVNTGWTPKMHDDAKPDEKCHHAAHSCKSDTASDILTLWGMTDLGTEQSDTFALSVSYDPEKAAPQHLGKGFFGLATKDAAGNWINAVEKNFGGTKMFVMGPWKAEYELGTYGVDPSSKTAWAVINYAGDFAVARFMSAAE